MTPVTTTRGNDSRAVSEVIRGLVAMTGIATLVVVPLLVLPSLGWPLPHGMPTPAGVFDALVHRGVSVSVVLRAAAAVAWVAWAVLSACVVVEAVAWVRRRAARPVRGLGGVQALAANLVAVAVLALPSLPRLAATPASTSLTTAARPPAVAIVAEATSTAPTSMPPMSMPTDPPTTTVVSAPGSTQAAPRPYVVQRYDCLWTIAETHLGDPYRWPEIEILTDPLTQPDGRYLGDPNLIYPGWTLLLPADATGLDQASLHADPTSPPAPSVPPSAPAGPGSSAQAQDPSSAPHAVAPATNPAPTPIALSPPRAASTTTPSPATTPATRNAASTRARAPESPRHARRSTVPISSAAVAGVGLSGLLGGIFVWRMRREAMAAHRRRRRGRPLPQPDPATEAVERRVRAIASEETVHWVDATLRYATTVLADAGGGGVEGVVCARPGRLGMEVVVDPPSPPVGRFDSPDGGRTWTLDAAMELAELQDLAWGQVLVPALCSVGTSADGPVLVDLEQAGVLAVEGDPARVRGFLAGAALELTNAPWSQDTAVYLLGGDERLARRDMTEVVDDATAFVAGLDRLTCLVDQADLGTAASTLAARVAPGNAEGWFPAVVIAHPGTDAEALVALAERAWPRRSGLVLIGPGPLPGATWRLVLGAEGLGILEPLGLELDSRVDAEVVAAMTGRLAARTERTDVAPVIEPVAGDGLAPPRAVAGEGGAGNEPVEAEVLVLGPVEVTWGTSDDGCAPERVNLLAALVAYLGTHDDHPVPGPRLQEAIWPLGDGGDVRAGSVKDATLRATVSRARKALGTDSLGRNHLPAARGGAYRLGPRFDCDWSRFRRLVAGAEVASSAEAMDLLRDALALVRGRPFDLAPAANFAWADDSPLVSDIEVAVVAAAEDLGERALEAGQPELADWAARQGLRVVPVREDLYRVRMQAAFDAGDADGIEQAHTEARRSVRLIDEELQDDTEWLYQRLRRSCRTRETEDRQEADAGDLWVPSGVASRSS